MINLPTEKYGLNTLFVKKQNKQPSLLFYIDRSFVVAYGIPGKVVSKMAPSRFSGWGNGQFGKTITIGFIVQKKGVSESESPSSK